MRRRGHARGISPVVATMAMIAVTIIAGMAVFSFVNNQAGVSQQRLGESTSTYLNQLNERFVTVNANFSSNKVTIWFYNNGNLTTNINQIWVWNVSRSLFLSYSSSNSTLESPALPLSLPKGATATVTLTLPGSLTFNNGRTYFIQALATYGNTYNYYQVK